MTWFAQAPANIALIKYMGKTDPTRNQPCNASLSYTLPNLLSSVELTVSNQANDTWEPLITDHQDPLNLDAAGQQRFLNHLAFLKQTYKFTGHFVVRSANNFPRNTGLASSASSFAALTRCAIHALSELTQHDLPPIAHMAKLSQQGSGSSCRSFFSPWALWTPIDVNAPQLAYPQLNHYAILVDTQQKAVSSSTAHQRVTTSPFFTDRPQRATQRLQQLLAALTTQNWRHAYQICRAEFEDMHQLFATATPPFTYITENAQSILNQLYAFWEQYGDGPLITMDAGPNIHLLFRPDQHQLSQQLLQASWLTPYDIR